MHAELPEAIHPNEIRYERGNAVEEIFNGLTHAIGAGLAIAGSLSFFMGYSVHMEYPG